MELEKSSPQIHAADIDGFELISTIAYLRMMDDLIQTLRQIIESVGIRHYVGSVRRDPVCYAAVMAATADQPETIRLVERIYMCLHPGSDPICSKGRHRRWINLSQGFGYCGRGKNCPCLMEETSAKVSASLNRKTKEDWQRASDRRRQTVRQRYGVDNVSDLPEIKEKRSATTMERHGFRSPLQIERREARMIELYGMPNPQQVREIRERTNQTNLQRYGGHSPAAASVVREKIRSRIWERYEELYGTVQERFEDFITKCRRVHGDRYRYTQYTGALDKVPIECPIHGTFWQAAYVHQRGQGCPQCSKEGQVYTRDEYIRTVRLVHGDRYTYDGLVYNGIRSPILATCLDHGDFPVLAHYHQQGTGCPSCFSKFSRGEDEVADYVRGLCGEDRIVRHYKPFGDDRHLDIYVPDMNLAIEYNGLYWHSDGVRGRTDPTKFYLKRHIRKHRDCERLGIRLVTIFEDEWQETPDIVRSTLAHFFGKSSRGVGARSVRMEEIEWSRAREFLNAHHLMGSGAAGTYRIGAFHGSDLIGVMTFGSPSDERGRSDWIEMKRFATDGRNHPGLGSRMFQWAVRQYDLERVVAFVDRRWFTGSFKAIAGFRSAGVTAPALFWTDYRYRYNRRFMTKDELDQMEQFRGRGLSKTEMMHELHYYRIWDCGKIRFEWTKSV